jgi:integrase
VSRAGSVKKAGDGTWFFVVDTAPEGAKRRQVRRRGFRTKADAQAALTALLHGVAEGAFVEPSKLTVSEWLERWVATQAVVGKSPTTLAGYERDVRNHVDPAVGAARLQALTAADVDRLYATMAAKGLAAGTIKKIHGLVAKALGDAERKGLVGRNVARSADPPSTKAARAGEMRVWSPAELRTFLAVTAADEHFPVWRLTAMTGMRRGEVFGLLWRDVDLEAGTLLIRRQLTTVGYEVITREVPKSDSGRRTIDLDPETVAVLRRWKATQAGWRLAVGPGWRDTGLVFTGPDGSAHHPELVARRIAPLARKAGVPVIRFHDLRHTHASHWLAAGQNIKALSERLGHANAAITLRVYAHLMPGQGREAALAVAQFVGG